MKPFILPKGMTEQMYSEYLLDRQNELEEELRREMNREHLIPEYQLDAHQEYIDAIITELDHLEREIEVFLARRS